MMTLSSRRTTRQSSVGRRSATSLRLAVSCSRRTTIRRRHPSSARPTPLTEWVTHADLVLIDPVSTGFTRAIDKDEEKAYHHFEKDIEVVGDFVRQYLTTYERWASPKFLAGESYGTTRSAGLAGYLQSRYRLFLNGVILISSVLNFQTIAIDSKTYTFHRGNDLPYVLYLPTYAATAWFYKTLDPELQRRTCLTSFAMSKLSPKTSTFPPTMCGWDLSRQCSMTTCVATLDTRATWCTRS
jgi:hypothetical protein